MSFSMLLSFNILVAKQFKRIWASQREFPPSSDTEGTYGHWTRSP